MPRGRPKGSKNRVAGENGELLPSTKEISSIAFEGRSQGRSYEFQFNASLVQREGILLPLAENESITVLPVIPGRKLGDNDDDGSTFCRFIHSNGYESPALYRETNGIALVTLIEPKEADAWITAPKAESSL